jgi:small subunit ribosomal protein S17
MENTAVKTGKKVFTGQVISDKNDKTIIVRISTKKLHPLYKKYVSSSKKIHVHDEKNEANFGDTVRVIESKPISKLKRWQLLEVVERAK